MTEFKLGTLDHIGLQVSDLNASIAWYEQVLGLKKVQLEKWGTYPTFMVSGKTGLALFQAEDSNAINPVTPPIIRIDHFAFNVSREDFDKAEKKYTELKLDYTFKDHQYFYSLYTNDPDGHIVELTTLTVPEKEVYK